MMAAFKGSPAFSFCEISCTISTQKPLQPCECFDGLIAIMLGTLRMSAQEAIAAYVRLAPMIFPLKGDLVSKAIKVVLGMPLFKAKVLETEVKALV
jgi:hypothetical protein